MYTFLLVLLIQGFFIAASDRPSNKWIIPDHDQLHDEVDVFKMWGNYSSACSVPYCDIRYAFNLGYKLSVIGIADKEFLSTDEYNNWVGSLENAKGHLKELLIKETKDPKIAKIKDDVDEVNYKMTDLQLSLNALKWAKKRVEHGGWSPRWLKEDFPFLQSGNTVIMSSPEEIKKIRLEKLAAKKRELMKELLQAECEAPETLPDFGTANVVELYKLLDSNRMKTYQDRPDEDYVNLKTVLAYFGVLVTIDLEWFKKEDREGLQSLLKIDEKIWEEDHGSRMYCRWQLGAIEWARKAIESDKCETLSWLPKLVMSSDKVTRIFNTGNLFGDEFHLPCPSADDLKKQRLANLKNLKEETEKLLHNFEARKEKFHCAEPEFDGDCIII